MKRVVSFLSELVAAIYCVCLVLALWWLVSVGEGVYTPPWMVSPFLVALCGSGAVLIYGAVYLARTVRRIRKRPRGRRLGYVSRETIRAITQERREGHGTNTGGRAGNRFRDGRGIEAVRRT